MRSLLSLPPNRYGPSSRNLLDVYPVVGSSARSPTPRPVVVFLTGGAWIIGYKMWGALMGRALTPNGVLLVIPDYRNFPQTDARGMMSDVDMALSWVRENIGAYGGDPDNIVLVGQSAGAHLGSLVLLLKAAALKRSEELGVPNTFSFSACEDGVDFDLTVESTANDAGPIDLLATAAFPQSQAAAAAAADSGSDDEGISARSLTPSQVRAEKFRASSPSRATADPSPPRDLDPAGPPAWQPTDLKGFICVSGP